jgi:hypothetical protein
MIARIIHLGFPIAGIDSQPLFVTEEGVARFVLTAGRVGILAEFLRSPALWRFHGLHRLHRRHWFHPGHGFHRFHRSLCC